jgi:hypothetical protein
MKYNVRRFRNMRVALRELAPFVRSGRRLEVGKPFKNFGGMRPREAWANWLLCAAVNHRGDRFRFTSDPVGGDGIIEDAFTGRTWPTEHVWIPRPRPGEIQDVEALILSAIADKVAKGGPAYARGKTLVVFSNAVGVWTPNKLAKKLPTPLHFDAVWVVGLLLSGWYTYAYGVTRLDLSHGNAPVWQVRIASDFGSWIVRPVQ